MNDTKPRRKRVVEAPTEQGSLDFDGDDRVRPPSGLGLWGAFKLVLALGIVLGASLGVAYGAYRFAITTSRFAIQKFEVEGAVRHTAVTLGRIAEVKLGDNIFAVDIERAERQLLSNPWLKEVKLTRRLPDTLRFEIGEHSAVASAVLGESLYLVNREGTPFKVFEPGDPFDLPVLTGISPDRLAEDRPRELERVALALEVLRQYGRLPLGQEHAAQEVHLADDGGIVMTVGEDAVTLELGHPPWRKKLLKAARVLGSVRAKGQLPGIVFLDNEAHPERVVVRMR
jgi:cell division protein FtsQ